MRRPRQPHHPGRPESAPQLGWAASSDESLCGTHGRDSSATSTDQRLRRDDNRKTNRPRQAIARLLPGRAPEALAAVDHAHRSSDPLGWAVAETQRKAGTKGPPISRSYYRSVQLVSVPSVVREQTESSAQSRSSHTARRDCKPNGGRRGTRYGEEDRPKNQRSEEHSKGDGKTLQTDLAHVHAPTCGTSCSTPVMGVPSPARCVHSVATPPVAIGNNRLAAPNVRRSPPPPVFPGGGKSVVPHAGHHYPSPILRFRCR